GAAGVGAGGAVGEGGARGPLVIERNKPQVFATVTYFLPTSAGSHDLKTGLEWLDDGQLTENTGESGPIYYQDLNGRTDQVQLFNFGNSAALRGEGSGAGNRNRRLPRFLPGRCGSTAPVAGGA